MAVMWVDMGGNGGNLGVLWGIMGLILVMGVTIDMGVLRGNIGVLGILV